VWVLDRDLGTLTPISEADGTVRPGLDVGQDARDVVFGLGSVWVASGGDVVKVDPTTARVEETLHVGDNAIASLAVDEERSEIWLDMAPGDEG
jgi:hypothetical protein